MASNPTGGRECLVGKEAECGCVTTPVIPVNGRAETLWNSPRAREHCMPSRHTVRSGATVQMAAPAGSGGKKLYHPPCGSTVGYTLC